MLNYKLIDYKATIKKGSKTYKDLMSKVWQNKQPRSGQFLIVNKYYVARPDLISLAVYGSDQYADIICKVNGISNPFELNEDDIIICPSVDFLSTCCKYAESKSEMIKSSKDEISAPQETFQKRYDDVRSPNEQLIGDTNYTIDKSLGLVFY